MSQASLQAYDAILPELPAREAAVLGVLRSFKQSRQYEGPAGRTNRWVAKALGLDRDSVSPRMARLRQKGLVVEVGIDGKETLYEIVLDPQFDRAPGRRKPKAYIQAIEDAKAELYQMIAESAQYAEGDYDLRNGYVNAIDRIGRLAK